MAPPTLLKQHKRWPVWWGAAGGGTYRSWTTVGVSVPPLWFFTVATSSKVLLMGPSGLGQRGAQ